MAVWRQLSTLVAPSSSFYGGGRPGDPREVQRITAKTASGRISVYHFWSILMRDYEGRDLPRVRPYYGL